MVGPHLDDLQRWIRFLLNELPSLDSNLEIELLALGDLLDMLVDNIPSIFRHQVTNCNKEDPPFQALLSVDKAVRNLRACKQHHIA
jgi:hypothetical protein